jgi:hypothetical protein
LNGESNPDLRREERPNFGRRIIVASQKISKLTFFRLLVVVESLVAMDALYSRDHADPK